MSVSSQQWINEAGTFYPVSGDTHLLASPGDGVFVVVESAISLGTIVREPDADGFFLMKTRYEDEDHLCLLLRKKEAPSLYRGMLV